MRNLHSIYCYAAVCMTDYMVNLSWVYCHRAVWMIILVMITKFLVHVLFTETVEKCIKSINEWKDVDHKADSKNFESFTYYFLFICTCV